MELRAALAPQSNVMAGAVCTAGSDADPDSRGVEGVPQPTHAIKKVVNMYFISLNACLMCGANSDVTCRLLLCAGLARLLAGALRERTKVEICVKRSISAMVRSTS
jgi:hypothetical protein